MAFRRDNDRPLPAGVPTTNECCMICFDTSSALLMPCKSVKHPCCPGCLLEYAWIEVSSNKKTIVACPLCSTEWGLGVIKKYGQATDQEIALLNEGLSMNVIHTDTGISNCPGCGSYCERKNKRMPRVFCTLCHKDGKKSDFCWHCKHPWTNASSDYDCKNPSCTAAGILAQIQDAPMKEVVGVRCPSIRLCPNCGTPIEHKEACKQMTCRNCQTNFCFICLRKQMNGSWACGSYNTKCTPAPIQERVPGQ